MTRKLFGIALIMLVLTTTIGCASAGYAGYAKYFYKPVAVSYPGVFPGCSSLPNDLNHDGIYEDINGNGRLDFTDLVAFYDGFEQVPSGQVKFFDFNRNGRLDFNDVIVFYDMF